MDRQAIFISNVHTHVRMANWADNVVPNRGFFCQFRSIYCAARRLGTSVKQAGRRANSTLLDFAFQVGGGLVKERSKTFAPFLPDFWTSGRKSDMLQFFKQF